MHIDLKHLLEGNNSNIFWRGCDWSVMIFFSHCFLALEENISLEGRFLPMSLSVDRTTFCSLLSSLLVAALNQTATEVTTHSLVAM